MLPPVVSTISELRSLVSVARRGGKRIGLVPTMGALHAGHAALIRAARLECDYVVVTIFVNPTQFNQASDLERYPRTLEADRQLCGAVGTDLVFHPPAEEMYPPPGSLTSVEVSELTNHLCGPSRPGHFRGVATVVLKLFNIALADVAYFGQKDAQQLRVIEQMSRDLNVFTEVRGVPTVREADGLAMSSRNRFLDPTERSSATVIHRTLNAVREKVLRGERNVAELEAFLRQTLQSTPGTRLDYAQIVDAETLQPLTHLENRALAAVAVYFGPTRLIDNIHLDLG
jgi:pantoate--beta-alanine ligase